MGGATGKHSTIPRRAMFTWLVVGALFLLCGVLGYLQYRWIGEVSIAARERMRESLEASLARLSRDFNSEIAGAARALLPASPRPDLQTAESELAARYEEWKKSGRHGQMFHRIAIAGPGDGAVVLRGLDLEKGTFASMEWPAGWASTKARLASRLEPWQSREAAAPPGPSGASRDGDGTVFESPLFGARGPRGGPPGPYGRRVQPGRGPSGDRPMRRPFFPLPGEAGWAIFELNLVYVRDVMLPELLHRHLGSGGALEYDVEVLTRATPPTVIYQSAPDAGKRASAAADASVNLLALEFSQFFRDWGPPGMRERASGPGRGPGLEFGRWQMFVRHRAGSLEAVVSRTRRRNLAVTAGVLLLMAASVAALIQFTRRAQRLAEMQMDFVAGVSHELRTPLTVIHTAAYNLRGAVAQNASQVERYGALMQRESGRLKELVEQALRFANVEAGRIVHKFELLSLETVVEEALQSSEPLIEASHCTIEKAIDADLPPVLGDPTALKHVFQNLIGNAVKYGAAGGGWIGVFGSRTSDNGQAAAEIRVADRGPGIPENEQRRVFDAFFRGRRAVEDQVHGTGLGLNLAKKIVEAHGGAIQVKSETNQGAEFIVRIPAAHTEQKL